MIGVLRRVSNYTEDLADEVQRHSGVEQITHGVNEHDAALQSRVYGNLKALACIVRPKPGPDVRGFSVFLVLQSAPIAFRRLDRVSA